MWPWEEDEGPFVFEFWFTCPCGAEWIEFRELKSREHAENQVGMCVSCWSEDPVQSCACEEMVDS